MTTPTFAEISKLPWWIQDGVRHIYQNNPTYGPKDILMLKIIAAGPDFEDSNRYDAFSHIKVMKYDDLEIKYTLYGRSMNIFRKKKYIIEEHLGWELFCKI